MNHMMIKPQKRGSRSPSVEKFIARKDPKISAEQTSVRSESPDMREDMDLDIAETAVRLANMKAESSQDMTVSMRNDEDSSDRSRGSSSDGYHYRRNLKSSAALQQKQEEILKRQDVDGKLKGDDDEEDMSGSIAIKNLDKNQAIISDEVASEIFSKLTALQGKKTYAAKKNWTDGESRLLQWAIQKYCRGKNMPPQKLDRNDWMQIAGFIPGRNDSQCQYKFNQDKKSTIQKSNWVKREDEELIRLIRENGTRQWSQIAATFNANLGANRNGKQCRERWVNFLNPEIKKDPFTLAEDVLILEKRLSIGNKWSEIIKEMPGRTENNVKNRFNMMFKNIKDEYIKNRTHQSVFVMKEKCEQDSVDTDDQIDEEKLILQLIEKKKKKLEEQKALGIEDDTHGTTEGVPKDASHATDPLMSDLMEESHNMNMNETSRQSATHQTSVMTGHFNNWGMNEQSAAQMSAQTKQWAQQKEFLKMSNTCQNKQQINHAIEKLIQNCPDQINIIKRLVESIQEDINRMIRISAAYASNTSMGSTNNVGGTPGQAPRGLNDRLMSPNQNTLDQLSARSISPGGNVPGSGGPTSRKPFHGKQIIVGEGGCTTAVKDSSPQGINEKQYDSLSGQQNKNNWKSPLPVQGLRMLPNGQLVSANLSQRPNGNTTPNVSNNRSMTPNQMNNKAGLDATPSSRRFSQNRSMSPAGSEIPGEKHFVEKTTQETLIISTFGVYASRKGEDRFVQLTNVEQILFAPFAQLMKQATSTPGADTAYRQLNNKSFIKNEVTGNNSFRGVGISQNAASPLQGFPGRPQNVVSPSQIINPTGNPSGQIITRPDGQVIFFQPSPGQKIMQTSPNGIVGNPMSLMNFQGTMRAVPAGGAAAAASLRAAAYGGAQPGQMSQATAQRYYSNATSQGQQPPGAASGNVVVGQVASQATGAAYQTQNSNNLNDIDSKIGSAKSGNVSMILSGHNSAANLSGNQPIPLQPPTGLPQFNIGGAAADSGQGGSNQSKDVKPL